MPKPSTDTMLPYVNQASEVPNTAASHGISLGALAAAIAGWLPFFVALIPAIYYLILIFESKTVQRILHRRQIKRLRLAARKAREARAKSTPPTASA